VHAPKILPPANSGDLISGIDFAPTLLGLMGVRAPDYMMGAALFSPRTPSRPVVFSTHYNNQRKRDALTLE
jgi:arylsulfatase A-like enzyme